MPSLRIKQISSTLDSIRQQGLYYSVKEKEVGDYTTNRVKISTCSSAFSKNSKLVYSPATHLMGEPSVIKGFLDTRRDNSDDSASDVLAKFNNDKKLITASNFETPTSKAHIEEVTHIGEAWAKDHPKDKALDIPLSLVVSLYNIAKEARVVARGSKDSKENPVKEIILHLESNKDQVVRIHGFNSAGTVNGNPLKAVPKTQMGVNAKALGSDFPLNRFYIQPQVKNRTFVRAFLKYYYTNIDKDDNALQRANDETDLIIPEKKGATRKRTGRSSSPAEKPASAKGAKKGKVSKSASPAVSRSTRQSASRSPSPAVSIARSSSAGSRASSSRSNSNTVVSRGTTQNPKSLGAPQVRASRSQSVDSDVSSVVSKGSTRVNSHSPQVAERDSRSRSVDSSRSASRSASPKGGNTSPRSTSPVAKKTIRRPLK